MAALDASTALAAERQALLTAATAKSAALAATFEQRRAELMAERDGALRKARVIERDLTAKLDEAAGQIGRSQARAMELEGESLVMRAQAKAALAEVQARAVGLEAKLARLRRASRKLRLRLEHDLAEARAASMQLERKLKELTAVTANSNARPAPEPAFSVFKRAAGMVRKRLGLGGRAN